jgi:hypothetical protein
MIPKPCSLCGRPADVSILLLVSTLRIKPRQQESSPSISFCNACLNLRHEQASPEVLARLADALTRACEALTRHSNEHSDSKGTTDRSTAPQPVCPGAASDGGPGASCRPCLIACNSRQFDEVARSTGLEGKGRD